MKEYAHTHRGAVRIGADRIEVSQIIARKAGWQPNRKESFPSFASYGHMVTGDERRVLKDFKVLRGRVDRGDEEKIMRGFWSCTS